MVNIGQNTTDLSLAQETLLGLVTALSGLSCFSPRGWIFADACAVLANAGQDLDEHVRKAASLVGEPAGDATAEIWLCRLSARGALRSQGRGLSAQWIIDSTWIQGWRLAAEGLATSERAIWERAAQSLKRCASICEKAALAASAQLPASRSPKP